MIKEFKRLSFIKKISFLFILILLITLPAVAFISQQPKIINSKAAEPISIPGRLITPRIPSPTPTLDPFITPTITPTPTPRKRLTPPPSPPDNVTIPGPGRIRF